MHPARPAIEPPPSEPARGGQAAAARAIGRALNAALDRLTHWGSLLVLPLALLLFAQWPLREAVGAGSALANDTGQWVFALYVALALRHTTRMGGHMRADVLAQRYPRELRRGLARYGQALCVLPWAGFVLVSGAAPVWRSLRSFEAFPETFGPLYFIVKCSAWLLALLLALQALADLLAPAESPLE